VKTWNQALLFDCQMPEAGERYGEVAEDMLEMQPSPRSQSDTAAESYGLIGAPLA
jgi:hypothetical protein